jgi:hypothetical protein
MDTIRTVDTSKQRREVTITFETPAGTGMAPQTVHSEFGR